MGVLVSLMLGFIPALIFAGIVIWIDRFEQEPRALLVGVFAWGAALAAGGAFIVNSMLGAGVFLTTGSEALANTATSSLFAPVVEEILKSAAVLLIFLAVPWEFDSILDGIVYAAVCALGFAATENAFYIYTYGYEPDGWGGVLGLAFIRVILVGWQHPFYTAFTGIGLAVARGSRSTLVRIFAPLAGLTASVFTHAFHNTFASILPGGFGFFFGLALDWTGWLAMVAFTLWALWLEARWIRQFLQQELEAGLVSAAQLITAASPLRRILAGAKALLNGKARATRRFYQQLAELAHKKRQFTTHGDETGNLVRIQQLREEIARLGPLAEA